MIRIELLPQALALIIEFIWRRIQCDHIRFEQFHVMNAETGKLTADSFVRGALKAEKFKW